MDKILNFEVLLHFGKSDWDQVLFKVVNLVKQVNSNSEGFLTSVVERIKNQVQSWVGKIT